MQPTKMHEHSRTAYVCIYIYVSCVRTKVVKIIPIKTYVKENDNKYGREVEKY